MPELISPEEVKQREERAFLEGALACLTLVDEDLLDFIEKKLAKLDPHPGPALNLLRQKLSEINVDITEYHRANLKERLVASACILTHKIFPEEPAEKTQVEAK